MAPDADLTAKAAGRVHLGYTNSAGALMRAATACARDGAGSEDADWPHNVYVRTVHSNVAHDYFHACWSPDLRARFHTKGQGQKLASILFLTPVYQIILGTAAVVAVAKHLRGDNSWYKTARLNEHRARDAAANVRPRERAA